MLERFSPAGLTGPAGALATGATTDLDPAKLATAVAGSAIIVVVAAVGAVVGFQRREL